MPELITRAEYARRRGCSGAAVTLAVQGGRLTLIDGKIDPVRADVEWAQKSASRAGSAPAAKATRPIRAAKPKRAPQAPPTPPETDDPIEGHGAVPDYQKSRARREAAEADKAEMAVAVLRGELIEKAGMRAELGKQFGAIREGLLSLPGRLAPVLAAETGLSAVQVLLDTEIRAVLAQFVGEA